MSTLIVDLNKVEQVLPHGNADSLEIINVKGWQVVVQKGQFVSGDLGIYFPPDSLLTEELANRLGVWKYTSKGRIKGIRLRGEPSYGLFIPVTEFPEIDKLNKPLFIGDDVSEILNVTKWEPPYNLRIHSGDQEVNHPLFHRYTDIENYGNYPDIFKDDEVVVLLEKIHGTNSRVGLVENTWMAGTHNTRKKEPECWIDDYYWRPLMYTSAEYNEELVLNVQQMLSEVTRIYSAKAVTLFSEIYGSIQKLKYGHKQGEISFAAFDLCVDGKYLDFSDFVWIMTQFQIPIVPVLKLGIFASIKEEGFDKFSSGNTKVFTPSPDRTSIEQIREGFVIKPVTERTDPKIGRVILKLKNIDCIAGNYE